MVEGNQSADLYFKSKYVRDSNAYGVEKWNQHEYQNITDLLSVFEAEKIPLLLFEYRVRSEFSIPYHWHEWYEVIYVDEGKIDIYVENKLFKLSKGDLFYFTSGVMHKTINYEESKIIILHIQKEYINKMIPNWQDISISLDKINKYNSAKHKEIHNEEFSELIVKLKDSFNDDSELSNYGSIGLLNYILYKIDLHFGNKENTVNYFTSQKYKERLLTIFTYIDNNLTETITLIDLADHMSVSPQYLSKIFKKHLHTTFTDYLYGKRMERAEKLLLYTDVTLTDIALNCGFPNYQSFIRTCKNKYNMTPSEYRQKYKPKK